MDTDDLLAESGSKVPVVLNVSLTANKPLDAIVELNYEASSDEEERLLEANQA